MSRMSLFDKQVLIERPVVRAMDLLLALDGL